MKWWILCCANFTSIRNKKLGWSSWKPARREVPFLPMQAATRHSHICLGLWSAGPPLLRDLLAACFAFLQISCSFTLHGWCSRTVLISLSTNEETEVPWGWGEFSKITHYGCSFTSGTWDFIFRRRRLIRTLSDRLPASQNNGNSTENICELWSMLVLILISLGLDATILLFYKWGQ